ncbi:MAG: hypothetical protein EBU26_17005, partial [Verrucomicrobia bacterium]|nr:hypothetical protein [Verrucomicrobiota bacterium]
DPNLIAEAGADQTAVEGGYVRIKGTNIGANGLQAQDTFQWVQLQGPNVTPDQNGGFDFAMFNFEAPEVDVVTELEFSLTLTNGQSQSVDTVSVVVYPIPDLMVDGVEFDIDGVQLTDHLNAGESFFMDVHPSNDALSRPVFEFSVSPTQMKDEAFFNAGNVPSASVAGAFAGDWILHQGAYLQFHYADVTIRPNLNYLGAYPNGVSFLIWDRKGWSDGEDEHPIVFGVNGEIAEVATLGDLEGLLLGGTRVSIVGAEDYEEGRSLGLVSVVGAPIEQFVIGALTSVDVDHIYPAAPAWAQAGLIADAGLPQDVYSGGEGELNGSRSTHAADGSITYLWTQTGGPNVTLSGGDTLRPTFTAPQVEAATFLTFDLEVSDGTLSVHDEAEIRVIPAITIADAGLDQTALAGSLVQLMGQNEGPGVEGSFNAYSWTQRSGPPIVVDGGGVMTNQAISFYAPDVDQITRLIFDLDVTNGGITDTDSVIVTVYPLEDLGVACVDFDMGGAFISESYEAGDAFIQDVHPSNAALSQPLFEFSVERSRMYDAAFFADHDAYAYISPGYAENAVHAAKYLYWQYADVVVRPNPDVFQVNPNAISFLIR